MKDVYVSVAIPTNQSFSQQWYNWTHAKVARHFKRDKERVFDTAQNVRLRLLSKDFIGRWFFKHLTDELVDRTQAERILGGIPLTFIGSINPVNIPNASCLLSKLHRVNFSNRVPSKHPVQKNEQLKFISSDVVLRIQEEKNLGSDDVIYEVCEWITSGKPIHEAPYLKNLDPSIIRSLQKDRCVQNLVHKHGCVRSCSNSLWRISDLLDFAKFDHERYYYSAQGHTIDSGKFLKLLGYPETQYTLLQSLYRQGRIRPSELTEHACVGDDCLECDHGRSLLTSRRLYLAHNWGDPSVSVAASKLRWNDLQIKPFLREWCNKNMVRTTPLYIMRSDRKHGIDAGLLKYAEKIIDNEVVNDFKRMSRSNDIHSMIFNNGKSPELSNSEQVAWESDGLVEDEKVQVLRDTSSLTRFSDSDNKHDLERIIKACNFTEEEAKVLLKIDFGDESIREVSSELKKPVQKIHRIRQSALRKLRTTQTHAG